MMRLKIHLPITVKSSAGDRFIGRKKNDRRY